MVELYKSGGKPHTTPPALANAYTARPIPPAAIDALTLDEQTVRLPEDCEKFAATFLAVGFNQQTMVRGKGSSRLCRCWRMASVTARGLMLFTSMRRFLGATSLFSARPHSSLFPCSLALRAALLCLPAVLCAQDFGDRWLDELVKTYPQDAAQKDVRCLQVRS
jgi:hypothetical protein